MPSKQDCDLFLRNNSRLVTDIQTAINEAAASNTANPHLVVASRLITASVPNDPPDRLLSLPKAVAAAGGLSAWNKDDTLLASLELMCRATSVEQSLQEVTAIMGLGHDLWAYAYMRKLYDRDMHLYYATLLAAPDKLLPVVYTPTVGEACQKFGRMPMLPRGCYISITDKGRFLEVLEEYSRAHLSKGNDGKYCCDCIVFSDGGRILGLGDLGCWGMGIPIGKLDLYTVCAGVDPTKTIPVILDVGITGAEGNTARLHIRDDPKYTGLQQDRVTHQSEAGSTVNSCYYGDGNVMQEFFEASTTLFGRGCLLQFEDFNSNDAFPLLAEYRSRYLTYNDDIQGTAAVTVAGLLGGIKLRDPSLTSLIPKLAEERFLFHGAGSANIGASRLLLEEAGVRADSIYITNSRGVIWRSQDGAQGNFRNNEQKSVAVVGEPTWPHKHLLDIADQTRPTAVVGAVGVVPNCFDELFIAKLLEVNPDTTPMVFALSNPKTQAEITATNAYNWSDGRLIFGSGTAFEPVTVGDTTHCPGQVNNVYIFPGMSFAAVQCKASHIPDSLFLVAAEAVANSLDQQDLRERRVVPRADRIQEVGLNVATAVVMECQRTGLAQQSVGEDWDGVKAELLRRMWKPNVQTNAAAASGNPKM